MKRARNAGLVELKIHQLRDWATSKHKTTDDTVYGGGQGMLLKPEPLFAAIRELANEDTKIILMTPQGKTFKQAHARELLLEKHLLIICGHYEGVDHRVIEEFVDEEISIGDYILTNGALAAAVLCDAVIRLIPGVLGDERSSMEESFAQANLLEAPAYTKPAEFEGKKVPDVLLSGNHAKIEEWKKQQALERTKRNRPDLIEERSIAVPAVFPRKSTGETPMLPSYE